MLTIHLNVTFFAYHGLYDEEKKLGNQFDVELRVGHQPKEKITDIKQALDYVSMYEFIKVKMERPYELLETLAMEITQEILEKFSIAEEVYFSITKRQPPFAGIQGSAGVSHYRKR